jgi:hypothetical protein
MPIGDQDHGGIARAPAVALGGFEQALDLGLGQVFTGSQIGVRFSSRRAHCPNFSTGRHDA